MDPSNSMHASCVIFILPAMLYNHIPMGRQQTAFSLYCGRHRYYVVPSFIHLRGANTDVALFSHYSGLPMVTAMLDRMNLSSLLLPCHLDRMSFVKSMSSGSKWYPIVLIDHQDRNGLFRSPLLLSLTG